MVRCEPAVRWSSGAGLAALGVLSFLASARGEEPKPPAAEPPPEVIQLTRASYKLKAATSEAVAAILKDNVKSVVLETKIEGDTLTVTTTPDAQYAVGQFIALLQGKPLTPAPDAFAGPGRPYPPGPGGSFGPPPGGSGFFPGPGGSGFYPGPGGSAFPRPGPGSTTTPFPGGTAPPPGATAPRVP